VHSLEHGETAALSQSGDWAGRTDYRRLPAVEDPTKSARGGAKFVSDTLASMQLLRMPAAPHLIQCGLSPVEPARLLVDLDHPRARQSEAPLGGHVVIGEWLHAIWLQLTTGRRLVAVDGTCLDLPDTPPCISGGQRRLACRESQHSTAEGVLQPVSIESDLSEDRFEGPAFDEPMRGAIGEMHPRSCSRGSEGWLVPSSNIRRYGFATWRSITIVCKAFPARCF